MIDLPYARGSGKEYRQERPQWCPHPTCVFRYRVVDAMCFGHLPEPLPHDGDLNDKRMCLNGASDHGGVFDLQFNDADMGWFEAGFDALREDQTPDNLADRTSDCR